MSTTPRRCGDVGGKIASSDRTHHLELLIPTHSDKFFGSRVKHPHNALVDAATSTGYGEILAAIIEEASSRSCAWNKHGADSHSDQNRKRHHRATPPHQS
jgi:hypothetical protein